jgi:hypothetical protein
MPNLSRDDNGKVWLTLKMDGGRLPVRQVKTALDEAGPDSYLHKVKGDYPSGFNHAERLECYTCHSAWLPTCYGCHITVDMSLSSESLTSGKVTPGKINGARAYVAVDSFVLMENVKGRIAPSMPSEKMFVTAIDAEGNTVFENKLRTGAQGQSGHGQRPVQPHTIQRYTNFSGCRTCHPGPGFENQDQVYGTIGLGTGRFVHTDDDGVVHVLDQIVKEGTYESTVLVGHEGEHVARPLPADVIQRMLDVEVE